MAPLSTLNPFAKEFTIATRMKALSVSECTKFEASLDQSNNRETTLEDAYSAMPYNGQNSESESNINHHQTSDSAGLGDQPSNESARNTVFVLSAREREELYEEPANTSNVMKAVLGYDPMDEKRICRHFNPNTGRCFKGNNCRLKHVAIMKGIWENIAFALGSHEVTPGITHFADGWTRDKVESVAKTFAVRKVPEPDEIVPILPMYIENLKTFYAYVLCACECPAKLTPKELKTQMNAEENRRQFRPISRAPGTFALSHRYGLENHNISDIFRSARGIDYCWSGRAVLSRKSDWCDGRWKARKFWMLLTSEIVVCHMSAYLLPAGCFLFGLWIFNTYRGDSYVQVVCAVGLRSVPGVALPFGRHPNGIFKRWGSNRKVNRAHPSQNYRRNNCIVGLFTLESAKYVFINDEFCFSIGQL